MNDTVFIQEGIPQISANRLDRHAIYYADLPEWLGVSESIIDNQAWRFTKRRSPHETLASDKIPPQLDWTDMLNVPASLWANLGIAGRAPLYGIKKFSEHEICLSFLPLGEPDIVLTTLVGIDQLTKASIISIPFLRNSDLAVRECMETFATDILSNNLGVASMRIKKTPVASMSSRTNRSFLKFQGLI